jgi:hypothetical protein
MKNPAQFVQQRGPLVPVGQKFAHVNQFIKQVGPLAPAGQPVPMPSGALKATAQAKQVRIAPSS